MNFIIKYMDNRSRINIVAAVLAYISVFITPHILKDVLSNYSLSNSLFSIIFFWGYFILIKKALENYEKRLCVISFSTGILFSIFMVFGRNLYVNNSSNLLSLKTWICVFGILPVLYSVTLLIIKYLPKLNTNFLFCLNETSEKAKYSGKRKFFIVWMTIFILWIPALLASYPGIYGYDSIYQVNYYISGDISLHHPLLHTYFLGFCVITLGDFLGSRVIGMLFYSIIQMLCLSAAFAFMYTFFIRLRASKIIRVIILIIFIFFPVNAIMSFSATKDVFFSIFFALAVMMLLLLAEKPELIKSVKYDICLGLTFLMMSAFRNQGIYIVILTAVIALLLFRKYKKRIFIVFLLSILLIVIYLNPISLLLGGLKADSLQEMLSVPCVQLSRAMLHNESELDDEEKQLIKEYISEYEIYSLNSGISDRMKNSLDTDKIKENPLEFIKLWVNVGIKCPGTYFDAFARLTIGYWYPDMNYRDKQAYHPYWEYCSSGIVNQFDDSKYILIEQKPIKGFEWLYDFFYDLTYENSYQSIPLISMLFSSGLSLWTIILYVSICIYRKQYRYLMPAGFVTVFIFTLLLGPVVLYRYVYPTCIICPMLLVSAMNFKNQEEFNNGKNCSINTLL